MSGKITPSPETLPPASAGEISGGCLFTAWLFLDAAWKKLPQEAHRGIVAGVVFLLIDRWQKRSSR